MEQEKINYIVKSIRECVDEFDKCKEFPYFYNNYIRKPDDPEITQEEWDEYLQNVEKARNTPIRRIPGDSPLLTGEGFVENPNVFASTLIKYGNTYYIYHNDESVSVKPPHRFKIS